MSDDSESVPRLEFDGIADDDLEARSVRAEVSRRLFSHPEPSVRLGRYIVLEKIGVGGRGVVFAAYDPQLERKVALKVVRPDIVDSARERHRLLREANALARLSHPNVVQVYDAGELGDDVFVAMELIAGRPGDQWMRPASRSWRDVVEVFVQAGRGLAAAHSVGLVHRDFKPRNFLVGDDGRVRVLDFGLARPSRDPVDSGSDSPSPGTATRDETAHTAVAGTLAYMAPEQRDGRGSTAAADQFSFCVGLYEGLYGERPSSGEVRPPDGAARVPAWLRRVVLRGLSADPTDRFTSMQALLGALGRDPAKQRRRRIAAAGIALAAAGSALAYGLDQARKVRACAADGASLSQVWNDAVRAEVGRAMEATARPYSADTWARTQPWLDEYATQWSQLRTKVCSEATIDHTRTEELYSLGVECLDERRAAFAGLVEVLADADANAIERAVQSAAGLADVSRCGDDVWLAQRIRPPTDAAMRSRVVALRKRLWRAQALQATARYAEAEAMAQAVRAEAEALGWAPLVADAMFRLGSAADALGRYADAEDALETAFFSAGESGHDRLAIDAASTLVYVVAVRLARPKEGLFWGRLAEMRLQRLGADPPRMGALLHGVGMAHRGLGTHDDARAAMNRALAILEASLGPDHPDVAKALTGLGGVQHTAGEYDDARATFARALAVKERALGPDHPEVASSLNNLGVAHRSLGAYEEARAVYTRAVSIQERALEPDHPAVARSLLNLGNAFRELGAYEDARTAFARALAIRERALGPVHPDVAASLSMVGAVHYALRRYEDARVAHTRALEIFEQALGPNHRHVAGALTNLGSAYFAVGEYDEARAAHARALAIWERELGPEHPNLAVALNNLGVVNRALGAHADAQRQYTRALGIDEKALGPDHPALAYALTNLGHVAVDRGRASEAVKPLERAAKLREDHPGPPGDLAETRFALALALWHSKQDRGRALELAAQARDGFREAGPPRAEALIEVEQWLLRHRRD